MFIKTRKQNNIETFFLMQKYFSVKSHRNEWSGVDGSANKLKVIHLVFTTDSALTVFFFSFTVLITMTKTISVKPTRVI